MGANPSTRMVSEANHCLELTLLKTLAETEPGGNIFFSPLSVASALSMLYCGSRGDTASEILEVLGLRDISEKELASSFDHLLSSLNKFAFNYSLKCANAAVLQKDFPLKSDYEKVLKKSFHANVIQEDFAKDGEAVVDRINEWVDSITHGMISRLLGSLDPSTVLVLLNAIYFKGTWKNQFPESETQPHRFYNNGSEANETVVDMMCLKKKFDYAEFETFQVLRLPYKGDDIAMLVLLPNSLDGLDEMEKNLTVDFMKNLKGKLHKTSVLVYLPKFRIEYSKSLKEAFQDLGMCKAFESCADLSGISENAGLSVSDIVHKAVIEVNEEGTVAAAATVAYIEASKNLNDKLDPVFIVDHPFLLTIYNTRNNTDLFIGRIVEL